MLDVSDEVRAEIGAVEADRLLAGDGTPGTYDCTSCRAPGDAAQERTSTVLFLGRDTAILAFAHASCIPSQIVEVSEDQLREAVRSITGQAEGSGDDAEPVEDVQPADGARVVGEAATSRRSGERAAEGGDPGAADGGRGGGGGAEGGTGAAERSGDPTDRADLRPTTAAPLAGIPEPASAPDAAPSGLHAPGGGTAARASAGSGVGVPRPTSHTEPADSADPGAASDAADLSGEESSEPRPAVLGVTCGQVLVQNQLRPALVVEPTSPISRPGSQEPGDAFLPLLRAQGFRPVEDVSLAPSAISGWSVLLATGRLHAILQPAPEGGRPVAWWQAHQPLAVTDGWRTASQRTRMVLVYAAPAGSIGPQPREDLLREALETAAARGVLVAAAMPLTGTPA